MQCSWAHLFQKGRQRLASAAGVSEEKLGVWGSYVSKKHPKMPLKLQKGTLMSEKDPPAQNKKGLPQKFSTLKTERQQKDPSQT